MNKYLSSLFLMTLLLSCSTKDADQGANTADVQVTEIVADNSNYIKINGVNLPEKIAFGGIIRHFVGGGYREAYFVRPYTLGLYMQEKSLDPQKIINSTTATSIRLQMTSSLLTSALMEKFIKNGFDKALGGETEEYDEMIDMVCGVFAYEKTEEGDVYDLHFTPGFGISASKNGKGYDFGGLGSDFQKAIKDDETLNKVLENLNYTDDGQSAISSFEFKNATYAIWFGDNPVDEDLKRSVLGIVD